MTKFFKGRSKAAKIKPVEPRSVEELQKRYQELLAQAATAQYLVYVHGLDLKRLNEEMVQVNNEASARKNLDAENAPKEEPTNVQA